ncbi:hypothetical protein [Ktedonobacter sp. SOSP1-52]|uniref:hypothetical protein n=1 Tax=Ktedonobacter sp. SOSP1-52 TaxID=2778366 RepID=UPI0019168DD3|nr:hypothetical protein [Ktedonobacter sp. SOSP1-52]
MQLRQRTVDLVKQNVDTLRKNKQRVSGRRSLPSPSWTTRHLRKRIGATFQVVVQGRWATNTASDHGDFF